MFFFVFYFLIVLSTFVVNKCYIKSLNDPQETGPDHSVNLPGLAESVPGTTAPVLASQAEAIVDLGRTWPQHRIDIH